MKEQDLLVDKRMARPVEPCFVSPTESECCGVYFIVDSVWVDYELLFKTFNCATPTSAHHLSGTTPTILIWYPAFLSHELAASVTPKSFALHNSNK